MERTSESEMIVLRALSALLSYPGPALRDALPEIGTIIQTSPLMAPADRAAVSDLVDLLRSADPLWAEERYVELFDRGRATSLHLFEHVHGEGRDRGDAMIELKALYASAGFDLTTGELPDYLPVVLEYLSCRSLAEARDMLGDCAHILRSIGEAVRGRGSPYSAVFQAVLGIVGEGGLADKPAPRPAPVAEDLDRDWSEQPAFAPVSRAATTIAGGRDG